ncbi:hypothetical protein KP22_10920 [Pectobacterium betavasculorum]|uniref:Uncharacterized protein n=1 Tax=Pectobacterium betavasculorum TaxID=55207 RepID=A0A093UAD0_9GAMM|nr:hypothetical protein KP22_10920 [Pectobacterium betavasculorum]
MHYTMRFVFDIFCLFSNASRFFHRFQTRFCCLWRDSFADFLRLQTVFSNLVVNPLAIVRGAR